jgi:hypothetical protein
LSQLLGTGRLLDQEDWDSKSTPGKKLAVPISTNKLDVVVPTCNFSYARGIGRRIMI